MNFLGLYIEIIADMHVTNTFRSVVYALSSRKACQLGHEHCPYCEERDHQQNKP